MSEQVPFGPAPNPAETANAQATRDKWAEYAAHVPTSSFSQWEQGSRTEQAAQQSPDRVKQVEAYNDLAELRLFGSRGRKYTDEQGHVIADAEHPRLGILDIANRQVAEAAERADAIQVAPEPADVKNRPQPVRDQLAKQRKSEANKAKRAIKKEAQTTLQEVQDHLVEVQNLQDTEGLSLSQAELVTRLRRWDKDDKADFVGKRTADLQSQGIAVTTAKRRATKEADAAYERKDKKRLELIKNNDLQTEVEYGEYIAERNTPASAAPERPDQPDLPGDPETPPTPPAGGDGGQPTPQARVIPPMPERGSRQDNRRERAGKRVAWLTLAALLGGGAAALWAADKYEDSREATQYSANAEGISDAVNEAKDAVGDAVTQAKKDAHKIEDGKKLERKTARTWVLRAGENPWTASADYLKSQGVDNPTDEQILTVDKRVVKINHIDVERHEDEHLAVGTELKMPGPAWVGKHVAKVTVTKAK